MSGPEQAPPVDPLSSRAAEQPAAGPTPRATSNPKYMTRAEFRAYRRAADRALAFAERENKDAVEVLRRQIDLMARDAERARAELVGLEDRLDEMASAAPKRRAKDGTVGSQGLFDLCYKGAATYYGIESAAMLVQDQRQNVTKARYLAWYWMVARGMAYSLIGRLAGRDHSTIISGVQIVSDLITAAQFSDASIREASGRVYKDKRE